MIQQNNITEIELAKELKNLIDRRKELEKREKFLKDHFKNLMQNTNAMMVSNLLFTLKNSQRESLDKAKLKAKFGPDFLIPYTKTTEVNSLTVTEL